MLPAVSTIRFSTPSRPSGPMVLMSCPMAWKASIWLMWREIRSCISSIVLARRPSSSIEKTGMRAIGRPLPNSCAAAVRVARGPVMVRASNRLASHHRNRMPMTTPTSPYCVTDAKRSARALRSLRRCFSMLSKTRRSSRIVFSAFCPSPDSMCSRAAFSSPNLIASMSRFFFSRRA